VEMWNLHRLATEYHCRPSEILNVQSDWAAYQIDIAVLRLADHVADELKRGRKIEAILRGAPAKKRAFRSVRELGSVRKISIPKDGLW